MQEEIDLEISINVGSKKYFLRIPRKGDLSLLVKNFLTENRISLKHQKAIVAMVQSKIKEEEEMNSEKEEEEELEKEYNDLPAEQSHLETGSPKVQQQAVRFNNKEVILIKLKAELQSAKVGPPDSKMVYEQWKLKQKQKTKKQNHPLSSNQQSRLSKATKQTLSPDHFYKKGLEFRENCHNNTENQFKKIYPFKLHDKQLKQTEKSKLFDRLSKTKKDHNVRNYLSGVAEMQKGKVKPQYDQVKLKVKQCDDEIDRVLFGMIRDGSIDYARVRPKSKSPFRKTVLY